MNNLQLFNSPQFGEVRAMLVNEEPYFVGNDVANALGYQNTRAAIAQHVDEDDRSGVVIHDGSQNREMVAINESGVYSLVFGSKLPQAKAFKRWVTSEVLPTIRKTGGYIATQENDTPEMIMARAILVANQTITNQKQQLEQANKQVAVLAPKAALMDRVIDSDQKIDIGQAAKILQLPFGRNTLFNQLREKGVFFKNRNEPKQEYIDRGYFELKEKWIDRDNHDGFMVVKVLVTQRGLDYIARLFKVVPTPKTQMKLA